MTCNVDWNEAAVSKLHRLREVDGLSFSAISLLMGQGFTRNACIGKYIRSGGVRGIKGRPVDRIVRVYTPRVPTPRVYRPRKQVLVAQLLRPLEIDGKPYTALTIPYSGACKYPYDNAEADGGYIFCGHPVSWESPYCGFHASKCWVHASPRKTKVDYRVPQLPRAA